MGTEKRDSLILTGIHAAVFLYLYYLYQRSCMYFGREWGFSAWLVYSIGDRYVLILLNGMSVLYLGVRRLSRFFANPYVLIRRECRGRLYGRTVAAYAVTALVYLLAESGICLLIGACGGLELQLRELAQSRAFLSLIANLYLYLLTVSMVLLTAYLLLDKEMSAGVVTMAFLLPNLAASSSVRMSWAGKNVFWIGRVMPGIRNEWSVNLLYWLVWIALCALLSRLVMSGAWRWLGRIRGDGALAAAAVTVFLLYGVIVPETQLSDYFAGFTRIDFYLVRYLFYTLPVLMHLFYQSITRFNAFGLHIAFRGGSIWRLLCKIFVKCALLNVLYYMAGIVVLAGVHACFGRSVLLAGFAEFLLPLVNLCMQNLVLLLLAFVLWMWGDEHHYGFFGVLLLHLMFCVMRAGSFAGTSGYIPLTQGVYCLNEHMQAEALAYQAVVLFVLVVFACFTVHRRLDEILVQKFKW